MMYVRFASLQIAKLKNVLHLLIMLFTDDDKLHARPEKQHAYGKIRLLNTCGNAFYNNRIRLTQTMVTLQVFLFNQFFRSAAESVGCYKVL